MTRIISPLLCSNERLLDDIGISLPDPPTSSDVAEALRAIGMTVSASYDSGNAMSGDNLYKIIASASGYTDAEFLELGIGYLRGMTELSKADAELGICEALMTPIKSSGKLWAEQLYNGGGMSDIAFERLIDKLDVYKNAHLERMTSYTLPDSIKTGASFTFSRKTGAKTILPVNFCYNMPFHYEGGYLGTLPASDSRSKRAEFKAALNEMGCGALRFPGGTPTHQYFMEGEAYSQSLSENVRKFGGLYDALSDTNNYYIGINDFLDFCTEADIEPIFQVNTSFYVDPSDQRIHAITKNRFIADPTGEVNDDYYDRDRISEAASALGAQIDKLLAGGRSIKYWEIGNEEFSTLNYLGTSLSDANNPAEANYASISEAFIRVIKSKIPDAYIIVTGQFPTLESRYAQAGMTGMIDSMSTHYPFSNWTIPAAWDRDNLTKLAIENEVQFKTSAENYSGSIPQSVTETMTWRYQSWDSGAVQQTYAMALNTAHQWGEAIFETPWNVSVIHDLESRYFGALLYNKKFDTATRQFANASAVCATDDIPSDYAFTDEYHISPAGKAFGLLSEHIGATALKANAGMEYRAVSAFASEKDGKLILTVINKLNTQKDVTIRLSGISLPSQTVSGECMSSKTLAAMLPREYSMGSVTISPNGSSFQFRAAPYSINQFIINE